MNVGDIVRRRAAADILVEDAASYGLGVLVDTYESDEAHIYFEVVWTSYEPGWYHRLELELVSEAR